MSVGVFSVFGCLGGVSIDLGDILGCQSCSRVFEGIFGDSLHEGFSQTGANPPFWQNGERQDFFHLTILRPQNIKTSLSTTSKNH